MQFTPIKHILIVDDEPTQLTLISAVVEKAGYTIEKATNGPQAIARLQDSGREAIDLVLLDLVMPEMGGIDVMQALSGTIAHIPIIVLTAQGGAGTIVDAMRAGASDFIIKPASRGRILNSISGALEAAKLVDKVAPSNIVGACISFTDLVGSSPALSQAVSLATKATSASIPVLLEGESGVGKEMFARAIHSGSERSNGPFVAVNCGAIPANLVESILFGHEKGSFTGASDKHIGKFQEADGGTLFLDEVGELPLDIQVKLLRALQEREIDPIGAGKPTKINIRVISATNLNMIEGIQSGKFREDLYYRLNVFPIHIPPLRGRKDDIGDLSNHFLSELSSKEGMPQKYITHEAMTLLMSFDWPGNVRQLQNLIYRAVVLADSDSLLPKHFPQLLALTAQPTAQPTITSPQLSPIATTGDDGGYLQTPNSYIEADNHIRPLADVEKDVIAKALHHYHGRMSEAARRLGIGRSTLYRKVAEYGLEYLTK